MKILIVTHYYPAHGGGIELVARELLRAMRQAAPETSFTWAATDCDPRIELAGVDDLPMRGSNAIERKWGVPLPVWNIAALRTLARAVRGHDAVWLHDTLYMGNIAAYLLAKRYRKPVVITQHIGLVTYRNPVLRLLMRLGNRLVAAPMLKYADRVVFIAAQVQDYFARRVTCKHPPLFIPNGVLHSIFKRVSSDRREVVRQKLGLDDQKTLLFVGRFVEKKGLPVLRHLAEAMPDAAWIFAGRGALDPGLWNLRNTAILRDRGGAGIAELYQAADLLVLPSTGEGLPLVIQEAAACGLPVLCGTETAAADPRLPNLLFTAPVHDDAVETARAWRDKIQSLLQDEELRAKRGGALHEFAVANWSWTRAAESYAAIFREMVP